MCQFSYMEWPCGCEFYRGKDDVQYCPTEIQASGSSCNTSGCQPFWMIPRTDGAADVDFSYDWIRFMTMPKDGKNQFKGLSCKNQTYKRGKLVRREEAECRWHDDVKIRLEWADKPKYANEKHKKAQQKAHKRADQKELADLQTQQLKRQGQGCVLQ